MKTLRQQFEELERAHGGATMIDVGDVHLVILPSIKLPSGWSQSTTHVRFVVPNGFPYAAPDCFWADPSLRLGNQAMPKNSAIGNPVPGQQLANLLWFSWHVAANWNGATCQLSTYLRVIRNRFEALE